MLKKFSVSSREKSQLIDITSQVCKCIDDSGVSEGIAVIHIPHTTGGITINENADPDVKHDINSFMKKLVPAHADFRHIEGNSDGHIKSSLFGCSMTIIIENGRPLLGTWQNIYFCEFDGPRNRQVLVKTVRG